MTAVFIVITTCNSFPNHVSYITFGAWPEHLTKQNFYILTDKNGQA